MPYKVKGDNERAWKDGNGNYVQLAWDEDNSVIKMVRVNADGNAKVTLYTLDSATNEYLPLEHITSGGVKKVQVKEADTNELLIQMLVSLKKIEYHLMLASDADLINYEE